MTSRPPISKPYTTCGTCYINPFDILNEETWVADLYCMIERWADASGETIAVRAEQSGQFWCA